MSKGKQLNINWPDTFFLIENIQEMYPTSKNITLRFRIKKAEEFGVITEIGKIRVAVGRPLKVYAKTPVSDEVIQKARDAGVVIHNEDKSTITVAKVDSADTDDSTTVHSQSNVTANKS